MNAEPLKRSPADGRKGFVIWVGAMAAFALLPAIARVMGDASPWLAELFAPHAGYVPSWIVEPVIGYAGYMSASYGHPYALFDAFGLFGVMMAGAHFGAHYGMHGAAWKRRYLGVVVPALAIFAAISVSGIVQGATGDLAYGDAVGATAVQAEGMVAALAGTVLGANIGRLRGTRNPPKRWPFTREHALLLAIFAGYLVFAYVRGAAYGSHDGGYAVLDHTSLLAGLAVAGIALNARYGPYESGREGRQLFGRAAGALLGIVIAVQVIIYLYVMPSYQDVVWMLVLACISIGTALIGNVVEAHISARLKMRLGAG